MPTEYTSFFRYLEQPALYKHPTKDNWYLLAEIVHHIADKPYKDRILVLEKMDL